MMKLVVLKGALVDVCTCAVLVALVPVCMSLCRRAVFRDSRALKKNSRRGPKKKGAVPDATVCG